MVGGALLKIKVDENDVDKLNKIKKFTTTAEPTKRAALGELQNRVLRPLAEKKEPVQKEPLKDTNCNALIRNAKARVDTRLKKPVVSSNKPLGNLQHQQQQQPSNGGTAAANARKIITRSNSLRIGVNSNNNANGLQWQGNLLISNNNNNNNINKPKTTLTAKITETKVQHVKCITKTTKTQDKVVTIEPALKREDSNLSRRSLSKIKAALTREVTKTTTTTTNRIFTKNGSGLPVIRKKTTSRSSSGSSNGNEKIATKPATTENNKKELKKDKSKSAENLYLSPLLSGIEDIDANDGENLMLISEYAKDIYDYLFSLEDEHSIRPNHLDGQLEVQAKMRAVLIDWINEVHLQFHLAPETYQMALAIIDRYLQSVKDTKRSQLQLVGVTALFIAAKYEELFPPSIADFVYITDDTYVARQILQMELKIFKTLDCNLSRPLPINFLRRFSKAAKAEDHHHTMAKYFIELSSIEYDMAHYKPSEIAAASLFLSLQLLKGDSNSTNGFDDSLWCPTMQFYSRYSAGHLRPIAKKIASVVRNAPNAKLKAVFTKYQSSSYHKIAVRPELSSPLIDSMIKSED